MNKRLLLISNSTQHGGGYLDHCAGEIQHFLGEKIEKVLFVPYARPGGVSHAEYAGLVRKRLEKIGYGLESIHEAANPKKAVQNARAIFIGGGNTFVLLDELYNAGIIEDIRNRVKDGMPYVGTSAGSNVACPTIMTTNDMPIREVKSLSALNLVPFQINAHYIDPDPQSTHKGETRETRIKEYLVFNDTPVVGLREGSMLCIEEGKIILKGSTRARIFQKEKEPKEYTPVCSLDFLL